MFAGHRERTGKTEIELGLPEGATVGDLADEVYRLYPGIAADPERLVVAVNQEYRDHTSLLSSSDEVALIPPVSGGVLPVIRPYAARLT